MTAQPLFNLFIAVAVIPAVMASETGGPYQDRRNVDFKKRPENSVEYQLYNDLIGGNSRYQKQIRPVLDHLQPIIVEVGMSVMMIEELVEREQVMVMAAAIKMKWTDNFLSWDPANYDNLTWMAVSSGSIWVPDISIVNSPEPFSMTRKVTHVDIDYRGEIGFYPSGRLTTRCNLRITYFPFDHQHCEVFLESWIHPSDYLKILPYQKYGNTVDIKEYYTNHQWAIISYEVSMGSADYDGKNFSSITFVYMLKRKSQYYFMYFIFPQLLLSTLQTLSHTLPVEHPGRMAMLTSLFIGTSVTQAGVAVHIPKSSESTSLLQIYMAMMSCNLVFALIVTFFMMYAVLRYPNEEPSLVAIMVAFFSIVWPKKKRHRHQRRHVKIDKNANSSELSGSEDEGASSGHATEKRNEDNSSTKPQFSRPGNLDNKRISFLIQDENGENEEVFFDDSGDQQNPDKSENVRHFSARRSTAHSLIPKPSTVHYNESPNYDDDIDISTGLVRDIFHARRPSIFPGASFLLGTDFARNAEKSRSSQQQNKTKDKRRRRGQAASEDSRELKRRWLLYCVAVDKVLMYANAAWNIAVPLVLFGIIPATESPFSTIGAMGDTENVIFVEEPVKVGFSRNT